MPLLHSSSWRDFLCDGGKLETSEGYIEDIYFFEMNTKYISSNVLKISVNSRVRSASEIADIFNT